MVQNHRVAMSYHCYLTVGFFILDSLLSGSTVGYPSDSWASCLYSGFLITPLSVVSQSCRPVLIHGQTVSMSIIASFVSVFD